MSGNARFKLKSETTIPVVEKYFEHIATSPQTDVLLPTQHIKAAGMGGESALIQFLITWARNNPNCDVITPVQLGDAENEAHSLKHLTKSSILIRGGACRDVFAADGGTSIRKRTNRTCSLRVDEMAKGLQKAALAIVLFSPASTTAPKHISPRSTSRMAHSGTGQSFLLWLKNYFCLAQPLLRGKTSILLHAVVLV
ncbi:MAG: hypothetical protein R3C20_03960 [Planctomycetaceae bacterium]